MTIACCEAVEPCHNRECDGLDEVVALLPHGRLWNPDRGGVYGAYIHALGHIKTELNQRICQEWNEVNPCVSQRLLPYWAKVYSLPECVEQTPEKLCEWIELVRNGCPVGSLGFYQQAIDFVAPGKGISISVSVPDILANCWCPSKPCAADNPILITAPPEAFAWAERDIDGPIYAQDGETCREYWIPEIECLRRCVLPFGLGVGYQTDPLGPAGQDIYGVPEANEAIRQSVFETCGTACVEPCISPSIAPAAAVIETETGLAISYTSGAWNGTGTVSLSVTGLPSALTFTDNGNRTFSIGGAVSQAGTWQFIVTATNECGQSSQTFTVIAVQACQPATAPTGATISGIEGGAVSYTGAQWGGDLPITLSAAGLPVSIVFTDNANGTYSLTGNFPVEGTYAFTVNGSNACGSGGQAVSIISNDVSSCTTPTAPTVAGFDGTEGDALIYTSPAFAGSQPITMTAFGIPAGVTFADNGNGTFTLGGVYPAAGSYTISVSGTNPCGSDSVSFGLQSNPIVLNPITLSSYDYANHPCAVADSPACGQFVWQMRPDGTVWTGSNSAPLAAYGNWHDGTVSGSDYEARLVLVSGTPPSSPAAGIWIDCGAFITAIWDFCGSGESFNSIQIEVRDKATQTTLGQTQFCQQVGVDVTCQTC